MTGVFYQVSSTAYSVFHENPKKIALVLGLVSACLGWWASQRAIHRQEQARDEDGKARKNLVFSLIHDEIALRWKEEISPYLRSLESEEPLEAMRQIARMGLKTEDMFALKSVSQAFPEYHYLGDHLLVSEIVRGYLLICDFVDYRKAVERLMQERDHAHGRYRSSLSEDETNEHLDTEYSEKVELRFGQLSQRLDAIDECFESILSKLSS